MAKQRSEIYTSSHPKSDGSLATSNQEKQKALRLELHTPPPPSFLHRVIEAADFYTKSRSNAIDWHTCTVEEVQEAIFHAGNTSPGLDETPPLIIKKAWPLYNEEITLLFQSCLQESHHPLTFKTAILCAPPKP